MTTDRPRRLAAATLALAAAVGLSACGTGFDAATNQQYQPGIGANQREGDVTVYNALLVQNSDGTLSFSGGIVNDVDEPQTLEGASFVPSTSEDDAAELTEVTPSSEVTVAAGGVFTIGSAGELAGLEVPGTSEGRYVTITLTFDGAGDVTVDAPVVERTADYSGVAAAPVEPEEDSEDGADDPETTATP
ncbi:hypothetical protein ACHAAC_02465 [Aeromicrobium sp. CF4.19]|uniref:hypothetical protein n=1 Tax=Aeromicrobium sp. CF4.19 TaxID=3373082 RepID=UPI003EE61CF5